MTIQNSLFTGVSGLNINGSAMRVIGNNIANTNTTGFKSSRTLFSDLLSSTVASSDASQVGRGVFLSSVENTFSQGTFETTDASTDLAIEGSGFFIVRDPLSTTDSYTRDGGFRFDEEGYLTNANGFRVQGYSLDSNGNLVGDIDDIQVDLSNFYQATSTSEVVLSTNLNAGASAITQIDGSTSGTGTTISGTASSLTDPNGVLSINGTALTIAGNGTDQQGSAKNIATAANALAGVSASASSNSVNLGTISLGSDQTLGLGDLVINGVDIGDGTSPASDISAATAAADLEALINAAGVSGITVDVSSGELVLTAAAGENIQVETDGGFSEALLADFAINGGASAAQTKFANVTINGTGELTVDTGILGATHGLTIAAGSNGRDAGFNISKPTTSSNYAASIQVYDSLGNTHLMTNYFTKTAANTWSYNTVVDGGEIQGGTSGVLEIVGTGTLSFDDDGNLTSSVTATTNPLQWANGADQTQTIDFDLQVTQYAAESVINSQTQDGFATGTLSELNIDSEGNVLATYSNGQSQDIAQIALAKFNNTNGLSKKGENTYSETTYSGSPIIGTVGSGVGRIFTNSLEQSNVDLAKEFVKMITIQRGFQANSKIITTTDEMLGELINLKR